MNCGDYCKRMQKLCKTEFGIAKLLSCPLHWETTFVLRVASHNNKKIHNHQAAQSWKTMENIHLPCKGLYCLVPTNTNGKEATPRLSSWHHWCLYQAALSIHHLLSAQHERNIASSSKWQGFSTLRANLLHSLYIRALTTYDNIRRPLVSRGSAPRGGNWGRFYAGLCRAGPTSSLQAFFLSVLDATFDIAALQTEAENWCTWTRDTMLFRRFGGWLLTPLSGSLLVSVVLGLQAHSKPFFCRFWTRRLTSQPSKRRPKIGAREPATPCCFAVSEGGFWRPFLPLCWSL